MLLQMICFRIQVLCTGNRAGTLLPVRRDSRSDLYQSILLLANRMKAWKSSTPEALSCPNSSFSLGLKVSIISMCLLAMSTWICSPEVWIKTRYHFTLVCYQKFTSTMPGEKWQIQVNGFIITSGLYHVKEIYVVKIWQLLSLYCYGLGNLS